tara:strand:- start:43 stop:1293 length:1251 start_codon:yes stop_codon:yes gene_type:complete
MSLNNIKLVFLSAALYITLITGFFFNESLNGGAYGDWTGAYLKPIKDFSINFTDTLISYDKYGNRHSPIYIIFLSSLLRFDFSLDVIRLIHLHFSIILIFIFYKCLELRFKNTEKFILVLLSLVIFLSPTFRSLSIWPDSRLPGLLFFTITIYFFIKYEQTQIEKFLWLTSLFLIITSYISPNFSLFYIYFFYNIFNRLSLNKILLFFLFNLLLATPMLVYIFVMNVNFLISGQTPSSDNQGLALDYNFANKILIISSIVFFHLLPVIMCKIHYQSFIIFLKKNVIPLFLTTGFLIYFFNYDVGYTGGGVFFHLSHYLFDNNYLFFIFTFISLSFVFYLCNLDFRNLLFFFLLILTNIQNTIYHKYYEPLLLIIFFTILKSVSAETFLKDKKNIFNIYALSILFVIMKIYKNYYLT